MGKARSVGNFRGDGMGTASQFRHVEGSFTKRAAVAARGRLSAPYGPRHHDICVLFPGGAQARANGKGQWLYVMREDGKPFKARITRREIARVDRLP